MFHHGKTSPWFLFADTVQQLCQLYTTAYQHLFFSSSLLISKQPLWSNSVSPEEAMSSHLPSFKSSATACKILFLWSVGNPWCIPSTQPRSSLCSKDRAQSGTTVWKARGYRGIWERGLILISTTAHHGAGWVWRSPCPLTSRWPRAGDAGWSPSGLCRSCITAVPGTGRLKISWKAKQQQRMEKTSHRMIYRWANSLRSLAGRVIAYTF